jgi:alkylation response protein AidB-like acyl-CoA dehydrogenase
VTCRCRSPTGNDLFGLEGQLTEEERLIQKAARDYAQGRLAPGVRDAFRHEKTDPAIFREMGELGPQVAWDAEASVVICGHAR